MPILRYEARDFGLYLGPALQGVNTLDCTWAELIWGAITVGKRNGGEVTKYGMYSQMEVMYKIAMIYASLKTDGRDRLSKTSIYVHSLDPSEKSSISYYIGLLVTKLCAARLMSVPWIMHLDVYKDIEVVLATSKSRPDLIGVNHAGEWFIFEAKGRSHSYSNETQIKAKKQTRKLRKIEGKYPVLRTAVQAYFEHNKLSTYIQDPDEYDNEAIDLEINRKEFIYDYYRIIIKLLDEESGDVYSVGNRKFKFKKFPDVDISIGLDVQLFQILIAPREEFQIQRFDDVMREFNAFEYEHIKTEFIGKDGIIVVCGNQWKDSRMRNEPRDR